MNKKWHFDKIPTINPLSNKLELTNASTIGSCFARNFIRWLNYNRITNNTPFWEILYNPYSIYYEIKRIFESFSVENDYILSYNKNGKNLFIDPWRTWIECESLSQLSLINSEIDKKAKLYLSNSSCLIITYGLSEVWSFMNNYEITFNNLPYGKEISKKNQITNRFMSLSETKYIINNTIKMIRKFLSENIPIVLTLSPIPLKYTSSQYDIRIANNISKATLLLGIMENCCEKNVYYFPSYELIQSFNEIKADNIWQIDGRHLNASSIDKICRLFLKYSNNSNLMNQCKSDFFVPKVDVNGNIVGKCYE